MLGLVLVLLSSGITSIQAQERATFESPSRDATESGERTFFLPRPVVLKSASLLPASGRQPVLAPLIDETSPGDASPRPVSPLLKKGLPVRVVKQQDPPKKGARKLLPIPTRDPRQLRKVTSIRPFQDYAPIGQQPVKRAPVEVTLGEDTFSERSFEDQTYGWKPTDMFHFPLYFEDPPLERYGHTHHDLLQPFVSAGRFGVQMIGLPYQMTIDPLRKKMYTLGWYRPGEPAPYKFYQVPWNTEAALNQAGVMTGLFFIVP